MKEERREGMPVRPEPAGSGRKSLPYTEFRLSSADCADYADWPGGRAEGPPNKKAGASSRWTHLRYHAAGAWTDREGEGMPVRPEPAGSGRKSLPYTEFRLSSADCADYADWPGGRAEGFGVSPPRRTERSALLVMPGETRKKGGHKSLPYKTARVR